MSISSLRQAPHVTLLYGAADPPPAGTAATILDLKRAAATRTQHDPVIAAYKKRSDALETIGTLEQKAGDLSGLYEPTMSRGNAEEIRRYWRQVDHSGRDLQAAAEQWLSATQDLMDLGELTPTSGELTQETGWLAGKIDSIFTRLTDLTGTGSTDQRLPDDRRQSVRTSDHDMHNRDIRTWQTGVSGAFRSFIRTSLHLDPGSLMAGRISYLT
jgi:hypothetical protein